MEILIMVVALAVAGYFGYQYYQAKKAAPDTYALPEATTVQVSKVEATAEVASPAVKTEAKKAPAKKAAPKKAPAKKKPKLKVEK